MSDREFENYLALLSRLLQLSGKHRARIASELRAHLDERLEDLVGQGVPRDDAVRQALEEFGDAAGLAGQFVAISQNRRRRWLMRVMTFSVAAILLVAASLAIFWPGRNAAPGVAVALAQDSDQAAMQQAVVKLADRTTPNLSEVLNRRVNIDFDEKPLKSVAAGLTEMTGVSFYLSAKKLEEASVSLDTPITSKFRNIRLSTWLELALKELELTYFEKDDLILITTPEDAESRMEIRVYDCRDLLAMPAPPGADKFIPQAAARTGGLFAVEDQAPRSGTSAPGARTSPEGGVGGGGSGGMGGQTGPVSEHDLRADRFMEIIITNVDPQTWDDVGGPGSISEYNGLIVVTQTAETHKKVERLFDMLREAAGLEIPKTGKVVR